MQSRYFVGSLLIAGALGFLVTSSMRTGSLKSIPVAQLRAADKKPDNFIGQRLRMVGFVGSEKVVKVPRQTEQGVVSEHSFSVIEGKSTVQVSYTDALPDTFRAGGPVQVDGIYVAPGVMKADHVLTKCPSKYEAEEKAKLKNLKKGDEKTARNPETKALNS
ncbi:cytochrome c maturation protein CcmE [bacterium]|nr:MAG: cytochrome c maturation protein CcmE [bacterium]